jgi:DNA-binding beta-propeller fold protein YncE
MRLSLLILSIFLLRAAHEFRVWHYPDISGGKKCRPLGDTSKTAPSVEDFRFISTDLIIAGNGFVIEFIDNGQNSRNGSLVLVDIQNEQTRPLDLSGYPAGRIFKPHGMDYSSKTGRLYVVNHAQHDVVDVFKVSYPTSFFWCSVTFEMTIPLTNVPNGAANSVAEVSPDEILITYCLPFGMPAEGTKDPLGVASKLRVLQIGVNVFGGKMLGLPHGWIGRTEVFRCSLVSKVCTPAATNFLSANGIALSPDKNFVFVADCFRNELTAFARNETSGALTRIINQPTPYTVDNIQIATKPDGSYVLYMGSISSLACTLVEALTHDDRPCPGGFITGTFDGKQFTFKTEINYQGPLLPAVSHAAFWKDESGSVLLSGPKSTGGILICESNKYTYMHS